MGPSGSSAGFSVVRVMLLMGAGLLTNVPQTHAQAAGPTVRLVHMGSATIDDGKGSYEGKPLTGVIVEIDLPTRLDPTDLVAAAELADGSTISAFAFVPKQFDAQVSLDPTAPVTILNLGGGVGRPPEIWWWGWDVTVGSEMVRTWGEQVAPASVPGEAGIRIRASRAGKATLCVLFETTPEAVRSLSILNTTVTPDGTESDGGL